MDLSSFISVILASTPRKIIVRLNGSFTVAEININHVNWDITILGNSNTVITSATGNISQNIDCLLCMLSLLDD